MNATPIETLIDEALTLRRMVAIAPHGSFVVNEAAGDLRRVGEEALPEIENVIRHRIVPDSAGMSEHNRLLDKHPGLLNLWMAYFSIAGDRNIGRAVDFVRSTDGPVLDTALLAMRLTWTESGVVPAAVTNFLGEVVGKRAGIATVFANNPAVMRAQGA